MHKARSIQKWVVEIGVEELDWSAQSPDLNPNKNLGMNWTANCEPGLIPQHQCPNVVVAEWKQVPTVMFKHLLESLPRRVEAVIAAKGGQTPY